MSEPGATHVEAFAEVCNIILHTHKSFTPRDFFNHELLAEMPYKTLNAMLKNWLAAQVNLGRIEQLAGNTYAKINENKNQNSKNKDRKDIQARARADRELHERHICI